MVFKVTSIEASLDKKVWQVEVPDDRAVCYVVFELKCYLAVHE